MFEKIIKNPELEEKILSCNNHRRTLYGISLTILYFEDVITQDLSCASGHDLIYYLKKSEYIFCNILINNFYKMKKEKNENKKIQERKLSKFNKK